MKRDANGPKDGFNIVAPEESSAEKARMGESSGHVRTVIPKHLILSPLAQSEQMREFFIQMWIPNPELAKQAPAKVRSLLVPMEELKTRRGDRFC